MFLFFFCFVLFRLKLMKQYTTRCHVQIKLAVKQKAAVWTNLKWCVCLRVWQKSTGFERETAWMKAFLPTWGGENVPRHRTAVYREKGKRKQRATISTCEWKRAHISAAASHAQVECVRILAVSITRPRVNRYILPHFIHVSFFFILKNTKVFSCLFFYAIYIQVKSVSAVKWLLSSFFAPNFQVFLIQLKNV